MQLEIPKLEYPDKVRERFLFETKCYLKKFIKSKIYPKKLNVLVDEHGKRLYITSNDEYEKDRNIITKIKECYSINNIEILTELFQKEKGLRLVNFLNIDIPPMQLTLKIMNYTELLYRKLLSWGTQHLFIFKLRGVCLQKIGIGFDHPQLAVIGPNVNVDRLSPSLIFIDDYSLIGARTILQTHGIKSNKGYGVCYTIGPIYIMEGADIGSDCIVLPGTIIGKGCAAYPMTVIKKDISPVYAGNKLYPVTYNHNEKYPYRLNLSLAELKSLGISKSVYLKKLEDKIILAD